MTLSREVADFHKNIPDVHGGTGGKRDHAKGGGRGLSLMEGEQDSNVLREEKTRRLFMSVGL